MGYLFFLSIMTNFTVYGCYTVLDATCGAMIDSDSGYLERILKISTCNPWIFFVMANAILHAAWGTALAVCQAYQIIFLAMTTNERLQSKKYQHFQDTRGSFRSAFTKGPIRNAIDFFGCKCFGLFRPNREDKWFNSFSADEKATLV